MLGVLLLDHTNQLSSKASLKAFSISGYYLSILILNRRYPRMTHYYVVIYASSAHFNLSIYVQ